MAYPIAKKENSTVRIINLQDGKTEGTPPASYIIMETAEDGAYINHAYAGTFNEAKKVQEEMW